MVSRYRSHKETYGYAICRVDPGQEFCSLLWDMVRQIPPGKVSTYGSLAEALGDPAAARAVGTLLSRNPTPPDPPCHRVVYANGDIGWYKGKGKGQDIKQELLQHEGVLVKGGKVDLSQYGFKDFQGGGILRALREQQEAVATRVRPSGPEPEGIISALDVAYHEDTAYAARVDIDLDTARMAGVSAFITECRFPYIPGYLTYRERPALLPLLINDGRVHIVDGNGLLHPRRAGIACHLGVEGYRCVGVAKSLLLGEESAGSVMVDGKELARKVGKYYVSVGNLISLDQAETLLRSLLDRGIDPSREAHKAANNLKRSALSLENNA